jgi:RimJ/RimL family protein N-acetyltransferase
MDIRRTLRDVDVCPVLRGARVILEPLLADHAATLFPLLNDDAVWRYANRRPATLGELTERYRSLESRRSPDGTTLWLNWAVFATGGVAAGFVQATVSPSARTAEIGYAIGRAVWRTGLGSEAVEVLVTFLFETLAVRTVVANVDRQNVASLRLLSKLGFEVVDKRDERNLRLERRRDEHSARRSNGARETS